MYRPDLNNDISEAGETLPLLVTAVLLGYFVDYAPPA
jgi:hypothetical protein